MNCNIIGEPFEFSIATLVDLVGGMGDSSSSSKSSFSSDASLDDNYEDVEEEDDVVDDNLVADDPIDHLGGAGDTSGRGFYWGVHSVTFIRDTL